MRPALFSGAREDSRDTTPVQDCIRGFFQDASLNGSHQNMRIQS
jgi:hypothetical protein